MNNPAPAARRPAGVPSRATGRGSGWPVPATLIALSAIPLIAGAFRLVQLAGGPATIPADDRFTFPAPLVVHIAGAALYALVGAFQFVPGSGGTTRTGTAGRGASWPSPGCSSPDRRCG
ncbi:hypothetical protein [Dactylosporangium cerinum]